MATPHDELFDQAEAVIFADDADDTEANDSTSRKRLFSKELRCMMYGFGDDQNPYTESVDLLEDLVIEFITETTHRYNIIFSITNQFDPVINLLEQWKLVAQAEFK